MGTKPESISQLGLTFFGLTSDTANQYKLKLFNQLHEIVFYGQGGYTWGEIYNFPIWLRTHTYNKINEHYQKQTEHSQSTNKDPNTTQLVSPSGKVNKSAFQQASNSYKSKL